jgi:hypothetical protein
MVIRYHLGRFSAELIPDLKVKINDVKLSLRNSRINIPHTNMT